MMHDNDQRPGEVAVPFNPAQDATDANVVFIGHCETPWRERSACPKNMTIAREHSQPALLHIDEPWRQGLKGLERHTHLIVLYWMHEARRDLIVQSPRHADQPTGVFSLRSPVRPNPIAMATVELQHLDKETGIITINALDCLNGTPLIDIKPWFSAIDGV